MGASEVTTEVPATKDGQATDRPEPLSAAAQGNGAAAVKRAASGAKVSSGNGNGAAATKRAASGAKASSGKGVAATRRAAHGAKVSDGNGIGVAATKRAANGAKPANGNGAVAAKRPANGAKPAGGNGNGNAAQAKRPANGVKPAGGNGKGNGAVAAKRPANGAKPAGGNARGSGAVAAKRPANGAKPAGGNARGNGAQVKRLANGAKPAGGNARGNGAQVKRLANGAKPANRNGAAGTNRAANGANRPNGNGVRSAKPAVDAARTNGGATSAKRWANGETSSSHPASPTRRPALAPDELLALVESVQRTVQQPEPEPPQPAAPEAVVAPPGPRDLVERDERAPRAVVADLDDLPIVRFEPVVPVRRNGRRGGAREIPSGPVRPRPLPADRRAKLLATMARSAEEQALAERQKAAPAPAKSRARTKIGGRLVALLALLALPTSVAVLATTHASGGTLSRADASFISKQLVVADQRLRSQLERVSANGTSRSIERARAASLTTRSLTLEVRGTDGPEAARLSRALRLEGDWIDAVGSTLRNPRSALRGELLARDGSARAALKALPAPQGRRRGGAQALVSYARSRVLAGTP